MDDATWRRYERKFVVTRRPSERVEQVLRLHPAAFSEMYAPRFVDNCYFDSPRLGHYREAVEGWGRRVKIRVRWYGALFGEITAPVLELKCKRGWVSWKRQFALPARTLDETTELGWLAEWLGDAEVPTEIASGLGSLRPTLVNRYRRRYLASADRRYRVTVDTALEYLSVGPPRMPIPAPQGDVPTAIVEVKYAPEDDDGISFITNHLPFRMTKSSKYVEGLRRLGHR
ncbi:MAG: VTC domain-containing protein [Gemmatimonadota bacterium]